MKPLFIDSHCHIESDDFAQDREEVLARMVENQVVGISVGTDINTSEAVVELASSNEGVYACIGVHPRDNQNATFDEKKFETLVVHPKTVAIGECGLDYFRFGGDLEIEKKRQKELFEQQIHFATKHNKSLMLHCRDAYEDCVDMLENFKKEYGDSLRGNAHFFAGDIDIARRLFDIGFTISFTGVITFTRDYDDVVRYAPQDMILSETDAPWVAPIPFRGKRNEPLHVKEVVRQLAIIREEDPTSVKTACLENAQRVFGLPQ